jgi:phosphatidate cytidylyltransferase
MLNPLQYALLGLILFIFLASMIVLVKKIWWPSEADAEVWLRLRSWWVMVAMFVLALSAGKYASIALLGLISFLALREFFSMIEIRPVDQWICKLVYIAIPIQYAFIALEKTSWLMFFMPVGILLFLLFAMLLKGEAQGFLNAAAKYYLGLILTVFLVSHAAYLFTLPVLNTQVNGVSLLFYLVFLTQFNDILQYVWGKTSGKPQTILGLKITPSISPNKTLAGLLGGVLTTVGLAYLLAPHLTPFTPMQSIATGLLIGLGGFVGDVILSAIKRDLGLKDTSQLIPGHGGILDRIDSLIVTAPLFFYWMLFLLQ